MGTKSFSRRGGYSKRVDTTYRSELEEKIVAQMAEAGVAVLYESHKISYVIPASNHTYTPDFILPNGIIVEAKGLFDAEDRKKHLLVKAQYPHLDIRFVFSRPETPIIKRSKTTYAVWCEKHGFKYAKKFIPAEWVKEKGRKDTTGLVQKSKKGGQ